MRPLLTLYLLLIPANALAQETVLLVGGSDTLEAALRLELAPLGLGCARLRSGTTSLSLQEARAHAERESAGAVVWIDEAAARLHVAWLDGGATEAHMPVEASPRSVALVAGALLEEAREMPTELPRRPLTAPRSTSPRPAISPRAVTEPPASRPARPEPFTRGYLRALGGPALWDDARLALLRVSAGAWFRPGPRLGATAIAFVGELGPALLSGAFAGLEVGWAWEWGPALIALQASGQLGHASGATANDGLAYSGGAQLLLGVSATREWGIVASGELLAVGLEGSALGLAVASVGVEWRP